MYEWLEIIRYEIESEVEYEKERNAQRRREESTCGGDDTFAQEMYSAFQQLTASKECKIVWDALERRSDPNAKSIRELEREKGFAMGVEMRSRIERGEPRLECALPTLGEWCLSNIAKKTHHLLN